MITIKSAQLHHGNLLERCSCQRLLHGRIPIKAFEEMNEF